MNVTALCLRASAYTIHLNFGQLTSQNNGKGAAWGLEER